MPAITLDEFEALLDEAGQRAAATVGYDSTLFVNQALIERDRLIAERNITEITHGQEDRDQVVR